MNHLLNKAEHIHEEVESPVLSIPVNLTGPDTSVVQPWGGKTTVWVGRRCICDHRDVSGRVFRVCVATAVTRLERRFQDRHVETAAPFFDERHAAPAYTSPVVSRLSGANASPFVVGLIKTQQTASRYGGTPLGGRGPRWGE